MDLPAVLPPVGHSLIVPDGHGGITLRHDGRPPAEMRKRIAHLVETLQAYPESNRDFTDRTEHIVQGGMYLRKLFIPKGKLIVGKVHLKECMNILAAGDMTLLTEFGVRRITAGFTGASKPGVQKVVIAHEDSIFINVFRTDLTDIDDIEAAIATTDLAEVERRFHADDKLETQIIKEIACL